MTRRALAFTDQGGGVHRAEVELTDSDVEGGGTLHVNGVATVYAVEVDGVTVGRGRSMFETGSFAVGEHLRVGRNEVVVRCRPLAEVLAEAPRRPRARWRTWLVEEPALRWVRTSLWGRMPTLPTGPPVEGPWRPVVLESGGRTAPPHLRLSTAVVGRTGRLHVSGAGGADAVEVTTPDGVVVVTPLEDDAADVVLPDVRLWWPRGYGDQPLYDVRVLAGGRPLDLPGDGTDEGTVRRVGFRTVENADPGSLDLRVNGVSIFVRGVVWTPGDLAALDTAAGLGFDLVRVSGVTTYESDAFHARCDELGLLVWQDLMFATFDYPLADEDFADTVRVEVAEQAGRLRRHPSSVVVCGSAEHEQQAAMFGLAPGSGEGDLADLTRPVVAREHPDAIWVDSSPCGGDLPIRVDVGIAQYFGVGAYRRPLQDARFAAVRFASECLAFSNLPDPVSAPGVGVPRDNGADWDFADVREHYLRERHGPDATPEQAQRVTGEVMADVVGEWRRPGSPCTGGIVLWLRDVEPGAGWGLLDHTGAPKPAALALAPVLARTAVWFVDEGLGGLDVHVAHDGPEPIAVELTLELLRPEPAGGPAVAETVSTAWTVAARGHRRLGLEELVGRFVDPTWAYRFGPAAHTAFRARLLGPGVDTETTWRLPHAP